MLSGLSTHERRGRYMGVLSAVLSTSEPLILDGLIGVTLEYGVPGKNETISVMTSRRSLAGRSLVRTPQSERCSSDLAGQRADSVTTTPESGGYFD